MTDQLITPDERKRRERETEQKRARNARYLKPLGFTRCKGSAIAVLQPWEIKVDLDSCDLSSVVEAFVYLWFRAQQLGREDVRNRIKQELGVLR